MQVLPFACTDEFIQWRTAILSARAKWLQRIGLSGHACFDAAVCATMGIETVGGFEQV